MVTQADRGWLNYANHEDASDAMDIDWMTRAELAEAIPPAFTEYVGRLLALNATRGRWRRERHPFPG